MYYSQETYAANKQAKHEIVFNAGNLEFTPKKDNPVKMKMLYVPAEIV